jgi:hypothetical protein
MVTIVVSRSVLLYVPRISYYFQSMFCWWVVWMYIQKMSLFQDQKKWMTTADKWPHTNYDSDFTVTPTETFLPRYPRCWILGLQYLRFSHRPRPPPQKKARARAHTHTQTNQHISQYTNVPFFNYNVKTNYSLNCIFYRWPAKHTLQANSQIPYYLLGWKDDIQKPSSAECCLLYHLHGLWEELCFAVSWFKHVKL